MHSVQKAYPILFINGLLKEVVQAWNVELSDGSTIGGQMTLSLLAIRITKACQCGAFQMEANVSKSAVVVFARELVEGSWNWGEQALSKYTS